MEREQIVKVLTKARFEAGYAILTNQADATTDVVINTQADAIMELMPRWIPVTERLPEVDEHVLINTESFVGYGSLASFKEWRYTQCLGSIEDTAYLKETEVTHWMPLPEPYNSEKRC